MLSTEILGSFHEFFIVFTHNILYVRDLYPKASFEAVRHYGIAVHQNRHPELYEWIESMATNCMNMMRSGKVNKVSVVIMNNNKPLERFVIDLTEFDLQELTAMDDKSDYTTEESDQWSRLGSQYRACIVKLINMGDSLGKLPDDTTFTILLESDSPLATDNEAISTWIPADAQRFKQDPVTLMASSSVRMTPVQNVTTDFIKFSIWVEESKKKLKQKV